LTNYFDFVYGFEFAFHVIIFVWFVFLMEEVAIPNKQKVQKHKKENKQKKNYIIFVLKSENLYYIIFKY
jgi:hypothetical protein